jgi:hypothetical protein
MRIPVRLTFRLSAVYSVLCFAVTILSHVNERGGTLTPLLLLISESKRWNMKKRMLKLGKESSLLAKA